MKVNITLKGAVNFQFGDFLHRVASLAGTPDAHDQLVALVINDMFERFRSKFTHQDAQVYSLRRTEIFALHHVIWPEDMRDSFPFLQPIFEKIDPALVAERGRLRSNYEALVANSNALGDGTV